MTGYKGTPASSQIIWLEEEVERLRAENEKLREETRSKGERIGGYVNMLVKRKAENEKLRAALNELVKNTRNEQVFEKLMKAHEKIERLEKYEKLVRFIANDYYELSHDKVKWQHNDWYKRCRKLIEEDNEDDA